MFRTDSDADKLEKRVVKKRTSSTGRTRAARTKATRGVTRKKDSTATASPTPAQNEERKESLPERKAPTPIAKRRASSQAKKKQMVIMFAIMVVGIGGSAAIGFTDQGQIDVNQEIESRNERIRSGQLTESDTQRVVVPVQNTAANQLPDGGLIGRGSTVSPPAPPEPATTTATSTDAMASSTDDGTDVSDTETDSEIEDESATEENSDTGEASDTVPVVDDTESNTEPTSDR